MRKYIYAVINQETYDIEVSFDDPVFAIELAMRGYEVAVFDVYSSEFIGCIN